jgi:hypothetical protein
MFVNSFIRYLKLVNGINDQERLNLCVTIGLQRNEELQCIIDQEHRQQIPHTIAVYQNVDYNKEHNVSNLDELRFIMVLAIASTNSEISALIGDLITKLPNSTVELYYQYLVGMSYASYEDMYEMLGIDLKMDRKMIIQYLLTGTYLGP